MKINNYAKNYQLYKTILQNVDDIIFLCSISGDILFANKSAVKSYGYTEEELLTMNISKIRNLNITGSAKKISEKAMINGTNYADRNYKKDGSSFIVEVKSINIDIDEEKYTLIINRNNTPKLKEEEEIYELDNTIEHTEDAIINITLEGLILSWNKSAEKLYGYEKNEAMGQDISMLFPDEKLEEVNNILNRIRGKEIISPYETIRKRKNDYIISVSSMIFPIYDLEENIIGASIYDVDLANEKENTRKIKILTKAIEQSASPILIVNTDGNIEYINRKFEALTGYKKEETIGQNINFLNSKLQVEDFNKMMWEAIRYGDGWKGELCNKIKDGSTIWWSLSISSVKDDQGKILKFLILAEDITEKKHFIDEMTKKNDELKKALNSLKELQVQLLQEDKMASIGQLSAGIAHEINNPLGFVSSNVNTLRKYMDKFQEYINEIMKFKNVMKESDIKFVSDEAYKINELEEKNKIDYMLSDLEDLYKDTDNGLSRIKKIVSTLRNFAHEDINENFEKYNFNQNIEDTLEITKNELKYTTKVKTDLSDDIPLIYAKANEINQVLLNLILNSSYAIKEKIGQKLIENGAINIKTWNDEKFVYCSIEDNGTGISEENINKIFNPFFTTKPVGKGTGLGLSISYDIIVNKHKGNIKVESKKGEGTKIILLLPIKRETGD